MRTFPRLLVVPAVVFAVTATITCLRPAPSQQRSVAQPYCYDITLGFYPYTHASLCPPVTATTLG